MSERGSSIHDLPSALSDGDAFNQRFAGRHPAVFLDYDGTLTPIVDRPEDAVISENMREAVRALARRCTVCVVSCIRRPSSRGGQHGGARAGEGRRHRRRVGSAAFWTTTQLLTVSSQIKNPISFRGGPRSVHGDLRAIAVTAGSPARSAASFKSVAWRRRTSAKRRATRLTRPGALWASPIAADNHASCHIRSRGDATSYRLGDAGGCHSSGRPGCGRCDRALDERSSCPQAGQARTLRSARATGRRASVGCGGTAAAGGQFA